MQRFRERLPCHDDLGPSNSQSMSGAGAKDVLQYLRDDLEAQHRRRPSTIPPAATLHAVVGRHRFEVASLTPLEALLQSQEAEVPASVPGKAEVALELHGARVMSDLGVEISRQARDSRAIVARFANLGVSHARAMIGLLRQVGNASDIPFTLEKIRTPERIEAILKALLWSNARGYLVDARGRKARVVPIHFEAGDQATIVWRSSRQDLAPPFQIELRGPWSSFSFRAPRRTTFGALLATGVPSQIVRARRRVWRRVDDSGRSDLVFAHPIWPEVEVNLRIQDVSFGGVGVRAASEAMLLFPGLEIPFAQITGGLGAGLVVRAHVCHVGGQDPDDETSCGLWIGDAESEHGAWMKAVHDRIYPRTVSRATPFEALWTLYGDSGYLGIAGHEKAQSSPNMVEAGEAIRRLDAAPEIAVNVVWPSRNGVTGALTLVKIHGHTWFGQHMAKRSGSTPDGWPGRLVLREMHLHAYEHALRDPRTRWLLGYVRHDAGWPKAVHVAFPKRAEPTGLTCVIPFRAFKIPCTRPAGATLDPPVLVRPASDADLRDVAMAMARLRPAPYVEALDLVEERLRMSDVAEAWSRAGLMRERVVLVAERGGQPLAAGVFEATSEGVHVYGLLDCARLFALGPGGESAFVPLLDAARPWFVEHGRTAFMYFAEDDVPGLETLGASDLGGVDATVTPIELLPDLLEHLWEVTESAPAFTM
jgi:hypothetical protein